MDYDYVKALLYSYPMLGKMEEAVDCAVSNKALLSYKNFRAAEEIAAGIAEEIRLREALTSLRALLEKILPLLSEEENYLLEYKYFRRKKVLREKFSRFGLRYTERHYFRRQEQLLCKMAILFLLHGWTKERFLEETGDLFTRVLRAIGEGKELAVPFRRCCGRVNCQSS